ncbi:MAG: tyrosine-type recombinase/integrase [Chitinophagaceae bacterium]|nr:tyrosine-type recombinase/integrase [Chitinophagaceae bacterium]
MATFFMDIHQAIDSFLQYLKFEKHYSEHTIIAYQNDLSQFVQFSSGQFDLKKLSEIAPFHIRTWMANLKDEGISSRSINRKLSSLKSLFRYHLKHGNLSSSPLATVTGPKSGKKLPSWHEPAVIQQLLSPGLYPDDWEGRTAHLAVSVLYETGIRRSELVGLKEAQIDYHLCSLRVTGKGNKERILPVRRDLLKTIQSYVIDKKQMDPRPDGEFLLVRKDGKPVNASWIYLTVKKYTSAVTTQQKKSPHILRHSFATHLTNAGADLNAVKELLGHSSLAATQVYTHNSIEKLKNIHGKAHPKG